MILHKGLVIVYFLIGILFAISPVFAQSSEAERIVSLSPSLTRMFYLIDADDRIVGHTSFCNVTGENRNVVASQMNVNIEKILGIAPDLVIMTSLTNARDIKALREVGVDVKVLDMPESFEDLCDQLVSVGRLTGKENEADSIVNREKVRLERLRQRIPSDAEPSIFMQLGVKPLFSAVPETFMDDYIRLAGGVNIASDMTHGAISRESVLLRNPDVILIIMSGLAGQEEKQNWQRYPGLSAAENNNIFVIDEDRTASPSPVSFVGTVEEIIHRVYK